jgi:hypothetical protein
MDSRSRLLLKEYLQDRLPKGFVLEDWDNYINYLPERRVTRCRVLLVSTTRRRLVLLDHPVDPTTRYWGSPPVQRLYLHKDGELKPLIQGEVREAFHKEFEKASQNTCYPKKLGWWLQENQAMVFTGRGWTQRCGDEILSLIEKWKRDHSGGLSWE